MFDQSDILSLNSGYALLQTEDGIQFEGSGNITTYDDDKDGKVKTLVQLINGKNTVNEIIQEFTHKYNNVSKQEVEEILKDFYDEGFLENTSEDEQYFSLLTAYQHERYLRNIGFFQMFTKNHLNKYIAQKKISDSKICLLGLGGLGSHIAFSLAGMGVGTIKAVEFDEVELSNLNRQILYTPNDIGKSKAQQAEKRIKEFNPDINFSTVETQLSSPEQIAEIIHGFDFVISVADKPRFLLADWVNQAVVAENIPLLLTGLDTTRAMLQSIVPHETGCLQCWRDGITDAKSVNMYNYRKESNIDGDNAAYTTLVPISAGLVCSELTKYILGYGEIKSKGKLLKFDFNNFTLEVEEEWTRNINCKVCGGSIHG
ncbi:MAG: ThiF family adenylyltransferase [Streptococcaceae bacterium]|jgi:molybdopterin/thiamine biosynthesis adenylyltransferase|nr:ThiF family adenylyltransferase [Streptococcaceae bacterium]